MPNRAERRAAAQQASKLTPQQSKPVNTAIPEPGAPFPTLSEISPARLAANRANAKRSTGPSEAGRAISSQNRTTHGLARHNGVFKLLVTEDPAAFKTLQQSLIHEHQPTTPTESILVNTMTESHWLANRAQNLQDTCFDPATGEIADQQKFSLYLRYQTTHTRAFHQALRDLLKLRAEKSKADAGFVAEQRKTEQHEMKKRTHYWDVLCKDGEACYQISKNLMQELSANGLFPDFQTKLAAEFAKRGLKRSEFPVAARKAA